MWGLQGVRAPSPSPPPHPQDRVRGEVSPAMTSTGQDSTTPKERRVGTIPSPPMTPASPAVRPQPALMRERQQAVHWTLTLLCLAEARY